ncbi:LysR family transcriptional regulator [Afifella pfennigii]|uniref:LysR family transcriptional regulator n=1 Tax=Afifella pfennigii TaxID=209897 RepID=UPI00047C5A44|nr:LysR family transcriptional regulator [Afifella pfennigii]
MDTLTRLQAFVAVVEAGGFSAAARSEGRSKALMSKYVSELEEELGARLLSRTTRNLSLTEAGEAAYDEARLILQRIGALREKVEATHVAPRGRLRVSIPRAIGDLDLGRAVMAFLAAYPDIDMELSLEERFVDLVEERFDVAIRIASLADSSFIARKLAPFRVAVGASPATIARHGRPEHPGELSALPCIIDTNLVSRHQWPFSAEGKRQYVSVSGRLTANSPAAIVTAVRAGLGFGRAPWVSMRAEVEAGRIVPLLEEYEIDDLGVYALYPHRERMPAKLRAFIDHMAAWFEGERAAGRSY